MRSPSFMRSLSGLRLWTNPLLQRAIWNNLRSSTFTPYNSPKHLTTTATKWDKWVFVCVFKKMKKLEIYETDKHNWTCTWKTWSPEGAKPKPITFNLLLAKSNPNLEPPPNHSLRLAFFLAQRLIKLLGILWCYIFELWTITQADLEVSGWAVADAKA